MLCLAREDMGSFVRGWLMSGAKYSVSQRMQLCLESKLGEARVLSSSSRTSGRLFCQFLVTVPALGATLLSLVAIWEDSVRAGTHTCPQEQTGKSSPSGYLWRLESLGGGERGARVGRMGTGDLCTPGAVGESMIFRVILAQQGASFIGGKASQGPPG